MLKIINGIQQIGIGTADAKGVFDWYRQMLGFDILVFEDVASAGLMTQYTGNRVQKRLALLAMNLGGGGGLEIWQFKDRRPKAADETLRLGDLGINAMKIRSENPNKVRERFEQQGYETPSCLGKDLSFFFRDPWQNWVQMVREDFNFSKERGPSNGVLGALIGVSQMDVSIEFYRKLLGYELVEYDREGVFDDFSGWPNGNDRFRRVLLKHGKRAVGGFGELYGPSQIELVQALDSKSVNIFKNRWWGDLGYIHLCYDVRGMDTLRKEADALGHSFTVDSADSFDMGDAAGRFGYVEDPDGTLIELVETHKVPILKKWGIYLNLKKRNPRSPLPRWCVKMLRIHRVKK